MKIKRKIERIIPLLVMFIFIVTGCCILEKEEVYAASNKVVGDSNEAEVGQETEELDLEFLKTQYESIQ